MALVEEPLRLELSAGLEKMAESTLTVFLKQLLWELLQLLACFDSLWARLAVHVPVKWFLQ